MCFSGEDKDKWFPVSQWSVRNTEMFFKYILWCPVLLSVALLQQQDNNFKIQFIHRTRRTFLMTLEFWNATLRNASLKHLVFTTEGLCCGSVCIQTGNIWRQINEINAAAFCTVSFKAETNIIKKSSETDKRWKISPSELILWMI